MPQSPLRSLSLSLSVIITKSQRLDCTDSMIIIKSLCLKVINELYKNELRNLSLFYIFI
ncbi:hypothetical protein OQH61_08505 [Helicobacter sp. MIT 21-1697]|uniref:hypothetical protein n=1 Tax=Helicobacter sp. MIT 21-1697 TaxID=2993733 RepID=UPI00224A96FD|nr:hypothetical protein [Helicobacter sp. MIT 21-1697]MCX2717775.1 hypothetical protein [Helicobacter sp. MIT 21-1697]